MSTATPCFLGGLVVHPRAHGRGVDEVEQRDHGDLEAYDATECAWSAAKLAGVDAKTIARYVQVRDAGGDPFAPVRRPRLIDAFLENVEQMVELSECQVRAEWCTSGWR